MLYDAGLRSFYKDTKTFKDATESFRGDKFCRRACSHYQNFMGKLNDLSLRGVSPFSLDRIDHKFMSKSCRFNLRIDSHDCCGRKFLKIVVAG